MASTPSSPRACALSGRGYRAGARGPRPAPARELLHHSPPRLKCAARTLRPRHPQQIRLFAAHAGHQHPCRPPRGSRRDPDQNPPTSRPVRRCRNTTLSTLAARERGTLGDSIASSRAARRSGAAGVVDDSSGRDLAVHVGSPRSSAAPRRRRSISREEVGAAWSFSCGPELKCSAALLLAASTMCATRPGSGHHQDPRCRTMPPLLRRQHVRQHCTRQLG